MEMLQESLAEIQVKTSPASMTRSGSPGYGLCACRDHRSRRKNRRLSSGSRLLDGRSPRRASSELGRSLRSAACCRVASAVDGTQTWRRALSRINRKAQHVLESPMEEPAFRLRARGCPSICMAVCVSGRSGIQHKVMARGLGVLPMEKQLEQLMEWLHQMAAQSRCRWQNRGTAAGRAACQERRGFRSEPRTQF